MLSQAHLVAATESLAGPMKSPALAVAKFAPEGASTPTIENTKTFDV